MRDDVLVLECNVLRAAGGRAGCEFLEDGNEAKEGKEVEASSPPSHRPSSIPPPVPLF